MYWSNLLKFSFIHFFKSLFLCCRVIENEFQGLRNGILDQSAILLSSNGSLLCMNCKVMYQNVPVFDVFKSKVLH